MPRAKAGAAATAGRFDLAKAAVARYGFLTLERSTVLAGFFLKAARPGRIWPVHTARRGLLCTLVTSGDLVPHALPEDSRRVCAGRCARARLVPVLADAPTGLLASSWCARSIWPGAAGTRDQWAWALPTPSQCQFHGTGGPRRLVRKRRRLPQIPAKPA